MRLITFASLFAIGIALGPSLRADTINRMVVVTVEGTLTSCEGDPGACPAIGSPLPFEYSANFDFDSEDAFYGSCVYMFAPCLSEIPGVILEFYDPPLARITELTPGHYEDDFGQVLTIENEYSLNFPWYDLSADFLMPSTPFTGTFSQTDYGTPIFKDTYAV